MTASGAEAAFWAAYLRNRNVEPGTAADGALAIAGGYALCAAGTFLDHALGIGSARPLRADDLAALRAFYAARGLRARAELDADVLARDAGLLAREGLREDGTVLAVLEGPCEPATADGGIVVRATTDRPAWAALVAAGFADGVAAGDLPRLAAATRLGAAAAQGLFIAAVDGVAAGGGAVGVAGDRAFLFSAAVLPAYRRRGVHRALALARLAFARRRGAEHAVVKTASPAIEAAYAALGFARVAQRRRVAADRAPGR